MINISSKKIALRLAPKLHRKKKQQTYFELSLQTAIHNTLNYPSFFYFLPVLSAPA